MELNKKKLDQVVNWKTKSGIETHLSHNHIAEKVSRMLAHMPSS